MHPLAQQRILLFWSDTAFARTHNQRSGAFRRWLHTILIYHVHGDWKSLKTIPETAESSHMHEELDRLQDPASALNQIWEREHDAYLAKRILQLLENDDHRQLRHGGKGTRAAKAAQAAFVRQRHLGQLQRQLQRRSDSRVRIANGTSGGGPKHQRSAGTLESAASLTAMNDFTFRL